MADIYRGTSRSFTNDPGPLVKYIEACAFTASQRMQQGGISQCVMSWHYPEGQIILKKFGSYEIFSFNLTTSTVVTSETAGDIFTEAILCNDNAKFFKQYVLFRLKFTDPWRVTWTTKEIAMLWDINAKEKKDISGYYCATTTCKKFYLDYELAPGLKCPICGAEAEVMNITFPCDVTDATYIKWKAIQTDLGSNLIRTLFINDYYGNVEKDLCVNTWANADTPESGSVLSECQALCPGLYDTWNLTNDYTANFPDPAPLPGAASEEYYEAISSWDIKAYGIGTGTTYRSWYESVSYLNPIGAYIYRLYGGRSYSTYFMGIWNAKTRSQTRNYYYSFLNINDPAPPGTYGYVITDISCLSGGTDNSTFYGPYGEMGTFQGTYGEEYTYYYPGGVIPWGASQVTYDITTTYYVIPDWLYGTTLPSSWSAEKKAALGRQWWQISIGGYYSDRAIVNATVLQYTACHGTKTVYADSSPTLETWTFDAKRTTLIQAQAINVPYGEYGTTYDFLAAGRTTELETELVDTIDYLYDACGEDDQKCHKMTIAMNIYRLNI